MPAQKRQIAFKIRISDILSSAYVKEDGWQPNYIILKNNLHVSRVNMIGTVLSVEHDQNFSTATIDDGSGIISLRSFEKNNPLHNLEIGDMIQIIGRPRQYGSEKYVLLEICKKITNPAWLKLRKYELQQPQKKMQKIPKQKPEIEQITTEELIETPENKILECIKKLDSGQGADYDAVLKETNNETTIKNLLQKGGIFEIRPGKLKVLE